MSIFKTVVSVVSLLFVFSCHQPVKFETELPPVVVDPSSGLYSINGLAQMCNISASQDPVNYPGCMMFLNFRGKINMSLDTNKVSPSVFDTAREYVNHDNIFVSNKDNKLVWFLYKTSEMYEMQDPEWSVNGDYLALLASYAARTSVWAGYAARMSDKSILKIYDSGLAETSDPYVWIGSTSDTISSITAENRVDARTRIRDSVKTFFGTASVKYVYLMNKGGTNHIYFMDYRQSQVRPDTVRLAKPEGKSDATLENPIVSPDGGWVTYHASNSGSGYEVYVQELKRGSTPMLVNGSGSFPHFWRSSSGALYLIFSRFVDAPFVTSEYTPANIGTLGATYLQEVKIALDGPSVVRFRLEGSAIKIADYPMKGGLTADGGYLATGYSYGYMLKLN